MLFSEGQYVMCLLILWLIFEVKQVMTVVVGDNKSKSPHHKENRYIERLVYSKHELLMFGNNSTRSVSWDDFPEDVKRPSRKRGRRGGIRARCRRRKSRVPLPMIVSGNVRSLRNKTDELAALCKWNFHYREASIMCMTEAWLQSERDPDSAFQIDGYQIVRGDRTDISGKSKGGVFVLSSMKDGVRTFLWLTKCVTKQLNI